MILLVPIAPEVPRIYSERIWPGLVLVILLCLGFLESQSTLVADTDFVENLYTLSGETRDGEWRLKPEAHSYLQLRPLLKIAPAPGDWSVGRLLLSNFVHGGVVHLALNLIGAFAGARILSVFLPFACTLSIFILGGSLGILGSLFFSNEASDFIPHVGASGGIFAMMGAYYIYNFRFRTRYFFWFPTRAGNIALRTSWFFFVDVLLLELVLSAAQFLPSRMDSVDHLAHVFGFAAGMSLAYLIRGFQQWPSFLQTRGEFLYWGKLRQPETRSEGSSVERWVEMLHVNPYNDQLKLRLFHTIFGHCDKLGAAQIEDIFPFITPTFIRLHSVDAANFIREILSLDRRLPTKWLQLTPYDSIIRLARQMTTPVEEQHLLIKLVLEYGKAQHHNADINRKLELLMAKLQRAMQSPQSTEDSGETKKPRLVSEDEIRGSSTEDNNLPLETPRSRPRRARPGSR